MAATDDFSTLFGILPDTLPVSVRYFICVMLVLHVLVPIVWGALLMKGRKKQRSD